MSRTAEYLSDYEYIVSIDDSQMCKHLVNGACMNPESECWGAYTKSTDCCNCKHFTQEDREGLGRVRF